MKPGNWDLRQGLQATPHGRWSASHGTVFYERIRLRDRGLSQKRSGIISKKIAPSNNIFTLSLTKSVIKSLILESSHSSTILHLI